MKRVQLYFTPLSVLLVAQVRFFLRGVCLSLIVFKIYLKKSVVSLKSHVTLQKVSRQLKVPCSMSKVIFRNIPISI